MLHLKVVPNTWPETIFNYLKNEMLGVSISAKEIMKTLKHHR